MNITGIGPRFAWYETHRSFGFGDSEVKKFKTYGAAVKYAKKVGGYVKILRFWKEMVTRSCEMRGVET